MMVETTGTSGSRGPRPARRKVGRPSVSRRWAHPVMEILAADPELPTADVLRRVRQLGYSGGKTALYHLVALCRPRPAQESGSAT